MKPQSQFYSVQPYGPGGERDGGLISTDATSPQLAAEKALGEPLVLHGKVVRAQVWALNGGYSPTLVTLYKREERDSG